MYNEKTRVYQNIADTVYLLLLGEPGFALAIAAYGEAALNRRTLKDAVDPCVEVLILVDAKELSGGLTALMLVTDAQPVHPWKEHNVCDRVLLAHHVGSGGQVFVQYVALSLHLETKSLNSIVATLWRADWRGVDEEVAEVTRVRALSRLNGISWKMDKV